MPSRQTGLPEGTDHIIDTNIDLGEGGGTGAGGGATGGNDTGKDSGESKGSAFQFDKDEGETGGNSGGGIAGQVREQISSLKSQAGDKAREYADEGKGKATGLLQSLADILSEASGSVEERFGEQYSGVGRKASDSIKSLASTIDERSIDDLVDDARAFVQRSPVVAIGIAAVIGFAVARVVRSSISEYRSDGDGAGQSGDARSA